MPRKEEKVFTPTIELLSENSKESFPLVNDVDLAISWLIILIDTLADIAVSRGTNRLKRAHDAAHACIHFFYLKGTYIDDLEAPMPGDPCFTGLFVIANSPR